MIAAAVTSDPSTRRATADDRAALIAMITAFQDFETTLHPRSRPGAAIAADCLTLIEREVAAKRGAILVAERAGAEVGLVCCWADHDDDTPIHAAEAYLAGLGLVRVRRVSLAANTAASAVYEHLGYRAYEITYEKPLGGRPRGGRD